MCPRFLFSGHYLVMPRVCKYIGCRNRPLYGLDLGCPVYCFEHKEREMVNVLYACVERQSRVTNYDYVIDKKCANTVCVDRPTSSRFKGYCNMCFTTMFPDEPLSFQTKYKTKQQATYHFITAKFDGFTHDTPIYICGTRIDYRIIIGDTLLCVSTTFVDVDLLPIQREATDKTILIVFNHDKYINDIGQSVNPMLYMRLPELEEEIARQMERIIAGKNAVSFEIIQLFMTKNPLTNSR